MVSMPPEYSISVYIYIFPLLVEKNTKIFGAFVKICIWQEFVFATQHPKGGWVAWQEPGIL